MSTIRPRQNAHARRARPPAAFAVAQFASTVVNDGDVLQRPSSLVHCKVHGTTITLCGHSALTWFKFFDLPFSDSSAQRCPGCVHELNRLDGRS